MGEPDQQLREVEPDGVRGLEGYVDGDEGAGFGGRDKQVLRAGVAVRQGLRELVEAAEDGWDPGRELQQVGTQPSAAGRGHPGVLP